jgi:hypothetical protein
MKDDQYRTKTKFAIAEKIFPRSYLLQPIARKGTSLVLGPRFIYDGDYGTGTLIPLVYFIKDAADASWLVEPLFRVEQSCQPG